MKSLAESIVGRLLEDENLPLALPVVARDLVIKGGTLICPHCEGEIHEKSTYDRDGKTIHGPCGGQIEFPPPSAEDLAYFQQHWGDITPKDVIDQDTGRRPVEPSTLRA